MGIHLTKENLMKKILNSNNKKSFDPSTSSSNKTLFIYCSDNLGLVEN